MMLIVIASMMAAQVPLPTPAAVGPTPQQGREGKPVCHSEEVTGSLAGRRRVCHTAAEWQQINDNAVAAGTAIVDKALTVAGNGH